MKCKMRHPPGDEIYRDGNVSVFEVDGRKNKVRPVSRHYHHDVKSNLLICYSSDLLPKLVSSLEDVP